MARHDQKGDADSFVCTSCKYFDCKDCVDELRRVYTSDKICRCRRKDHLAKIEGKYDGEHTVPLLPEAGEPS